MLSMKPANLLFHLSDLQQDNVCAFSLIYQADLIGFSRCVSSSVLRKTLSQFSNKFRRKQGQVAHHYELYECWHRNWITWEGKLKKIRVEGPKGRHTIVIRTGQTTALHISTQLGWNILCWGTTYKFLSTNLESVGTKSKRQFMQIFEFTVCEHMSMYK